MTCPQCLSVTGPDAACCGSCETPAASVSQFPQTPGDLLDVPLAGLGGEIGAYLALAAAALATLPAALPALRSRRAGAAGRRGASEPS